MEPIATLKAVHVFATVVSLGSALGLALWIWRACRRGSEDVHRRLLHRPLLFIWLLMGVCVVSMPFTGWWLAHLVGWPLGQTWILLSSLLYTLGVTCIWWLLVRLNRLRHGPAVGLRLTLELALVSGLCFVSIAALMGAKPV